MTGPADDARARFRAWVRASHPDVGGDPAEFAAGLDRWRTRQAPPAAGTGPVTVFRRRGGLWRAGRWWRRHQPGRTRRVA